ncbi:G-type lectin S-receptor-like serine/threonine-protein kinase SD1-1 [Bidens hawaiensis]|uniref:G-type lectin S-receptor-like serine/threonine-protein kinase SD1-1 n=1 Tax=Bidens hawaiensis TaxID=980011 RepID=UPI0040492F69
MKKKKRRVMKREGNWEHLDDLPFFSLSEVARATCNFNDSYKIGEGGFGPVYKGVLDGGQEVAVKRLSETSLQGLEEFKNEVICIAKLQHRNLVKLLGYCIHGNEMILIYDHLTLADEVRSLMLHWPRFQIIHGIARGILYLHQDSRLHIIHIDIKAGNILLDGDMNPKISDFGLPRKFVGPDTSAKTNGYISPDYAVHGCFSTKSDVYSFDVLLLEIVSGKKNREFSHENHGDNLLVHVRLDKKNCDRKTRSWRLYKEGRSTELVSASLLTSCTISEVLRSIHVGLLCAQYHAEDRPAMLSVVLMLVSDGALPEPKQPAFSDDESCPKIWITV